MPDPELAVVYDRTSGDEGQGQDAGAQFTDTVHRTELAGFKPLLAGSDRDVAGDTPWEERKELARLLSGARLQWIPLVTREITRLWRGDPAEGLKIIETIPNLTILGNPLWERRDGKWLRPSRADYLIRFIELWRSWDEKETAADRTRLAAVAHKEGRRPTRSGRRWGRPSVEIDPAHLEAARAIISDRGGRGIEEAHRKVLELRGYNDVVDAAARKRRFVSRTTLSRALGLRVRPGQNSHPGKSPNLSKAPRPGRNRPINDDSTGGPQ